MDLDWITLYDYISISSRSEITSKINKFYESFYPLKLKKTGKKTFAIKQISRGGLIGIVASYISKVLFALEIYFQTEYLLAEGSMKQVLRLSKMFVEIETENLQASLKLEKIVYVIVEANKFYNEKEDEKDIDKGFILKRILQFYYHMEKIKKRLQSVGYSRIYDIIQNYSLEVYMKTKEQLKLFPQIKELLECILRFFDEEGEKNFNFYTHFTLESNSDIKKSFSLQVKKLFTLIPSKQKNLFIILGDQSFFDFLIKSGCSISKELVENFSRAEEQINSLIAEEENFVESILVPDVHRGKPEWRKQVVQQLMNLSLETKKTEKSKLLESERFKLSNDFPLNFQ